MTQIKVAGCPIFTIAGTIGGKAVTDFCFSRPMLKWVLTQAELMDRVMEAAGVNPVRAARVDRGMAWYEARSRCIACHDNLRCRAWLAARKDRQVQDLPPHCPNRAFFELAKRPAELMEDCRDREPAGVEAVLEARHAKQHDRPRTRRNPPH